MFEINVVGLDEELKRLEGLEKQIPFALAKTLTNTAQAVKADLVEGMKRSFDRPTKFTLNSLYIKPARKNKLFAAVYIKDDKPLKGTAAADYLAPQIEGGPRRQKRSEMALHYRKGLKKSERLVPGKSVRLNKFGNLTKGSIGKMLSNIGSQLDHNQNTTNNSKKKFFWVDSDRGRLKRGVYQRVGKNKVRTYLLAVDNFSYRKRFDYWGIAQRSMNRHIAPILRRNIDAIIDEKAARQAEISSFF